MGWATITSLVFIFNRLGLGTNILILFIGAIIGVYNISAEDDF